MTWRISHTVLKVCYQEPKQDCKMDRSISVEEVARMSVEDCLQLDPSPIPEIPQEALMNFGVPQSIVIHLPQIVLHIFGITIKISGKQVTARIKISVSHLSISQQHVVSQQYIGNIIYIAVHIIATVCTHQLS